MDSIYLWIICLILVSFPIAFYLFVQNYEIIEYWKRRGIVYFPATGLFSKDIFNSFLIQHISLTKIYNHGKGEACCGFFQFRKPVLLIRNAGIVNLILNGESKYFQDKRSPEYSENIRDPLSQHLLALNGFKWRCLRAKLSPTFTAEKLRSMFPLLENCVEKFIHQIEEADDKGVDIIQICQKLSVDSIASCAFGLELNCLDNENKDFLRMGKIPFREGNWRMFKAHVRTLYPQLFKMFKLKAYDKELSDFFCSLVRNTIDLRKKTKKTRSDFINLLMKLLEEDENAVQEDKISSKMKFTSDLITAQAFSFFIGGYETTSLTMFCIFYELARNEEIQEKVQNEIDSLLPSTGQITYEDLKSLQYLDMVIKEVLRLHPPAFYIQRICSENFHIPGRSLTIEKNMEVFIPILQIHNDERYFTNASKFVPERFSRENKINILKGTYLPFGDGPRKCIGMRFSLMELKLTLAKVLRDYNFKFALRSPKHIELEEYSRIYKIKNKIFIQFSKRIKNELL